jgi:hypothetical protein
LLSQRTFPAFNVSEPSRKFAAQLGLRSSSNAASSTSPSQCRLKLPLALLRGCHSASTLCSRDICSQYIRTLQALNALSQTLPKPASASCPSLLSKELSLLPQGLFRSPASLMGRFSGKEIFNSSHH